MNAASARKLKILVLEDADDDAKLVERALRVGGCDCSLQRVETRADYVRALGAEVPDVIVADYRLPTLDGRVALKLARELAPQVPVIIVTGAMQDDVAVELLRDGAADYILKDRMSRLAPAIGRALDAAEQARQRQQAEQALLASEAKYRTLFESSLDAMFTLAGPAWTFTSCNPAALRMFGFDNEADVTAFRPWDLSPEVQPNGQSSAETGREMIGRALRYGGQYFECLCNRRNGECFVTSVLLTRVDLGGETFVQATLRDITSLKAAENSLRESEQRYRMLFESSPIPMWVHDLVTLRILALNRAASRLYGYSREEFQAMTINDIRPAEDVPAREANLAASSAGGFQDSRSWRHRKRDGSVIEVEMHANSLDYQGHKASIVQINDVTERKKSELQLADQLDELRRWHRATAGREDRIGTIKREVNDLLAKSGQPPRYPSAESDKQDEE